MAKKQSRIDELFAAGIDYSIPIDKFARKAQALFNRIAKKQKIRARCANSEYGDGAARLYLQNDRVDSYTLALFDYEMRQLVEDYDPMIKLKLFIDKVSVGGWEINISFC